MMKRLLTILCIPAALLLLSSTEGWSLPPCESSDSSTWNNCFGIAISPDGGIKYVGEWKDGKWHGQGTLTYADGAKYVGEFKDRQPHGQGTFTSPDGTKYVGELKDGEVHGQGTFTFSDGTVQRGMWRNGELLE